MPPVLIPIYQRAAAAYGLGPQGAAVLAGINEIETAFGTNLNVSSAGAIGWMQFIRRAGTCTASTPTATGSRDPYNPEDAIFAAARYLRAAGMPADTYGAIFAYNHADWYVAEVLANAACYADIGGAAFGGAFSLTPQLQVLTCTPATDWRDARAGRLPEPSRTPPPATNSASAASGRWPPSPASSPTSAAGCRRRSCGQHGAARARPRPSGAPTRSTATKTAASGTPTRPTRPPRWRG